MNKAVCVIVSLPLTAVPLLLYEYSIYLSLMDISNAATQTSLKQQEHEKK